MAAGALEKEDANVPVQTSLSRVRRRFFKAILAGGALLATGLASAGAAQTDSSALQIGDTQEGNYLSALVAGSDRDTAAAAVYFREALRADPRNPDLIERAFAAALADGDVSDSFSLADRLVQRDPTNSLARLTLAVRAISSGQYPAARVQLGAGEAGRARDVTTTLLAAWSYAGGFDLHHALEALDHVREPSLVVYRDYHAGLIADLLGDAPEAQRRMKAAYDADKNTLRLVDAYARFLARHNDIEGAKKVYTDFDQLVPHHPLVVSALADLAAGKPLAPVIRNAKDGAAEALYGLGGAGTRQGDELAALIYLRLALFLRPDHDLAAVTVANLFEDIKQGEAS